MANHDEIYSNEADQYELLISREDYQQQIFRTISQLVPDLAAREALDIGAGTGRLTCLLAPHVKTVIAADASRAMLDVAEGRLQSMGVANWRTLVAEHRTLSLPDQSVDLVTAGWTICYETSTNVPEWEQNLQAIMGHVARVLRPSGTAVIFENYGTGDEQPNPPDFLQPYYSKLEQDYGFSHTYIRTDYQFKSVDEAEQLTRFFFGDELAGQVITRNSPIVPECTGVWWKTFG